MSNSKDNNTISSYTPDYSILSPAYPHPPQEEEPGSDQEAERPDTPPPEPQGQVVFVPVTQIIASNQARRAIARRHPQYHRRRRQEQQQQQLVPRVLCYCSIVREETFPAQA